MCAQREDCISGIRLRSAFAISRDVGIEGMDTLEETEQPNRNYTSKLDTAYLYGHRALTAALTALPGLIETR